MKNSDYKFKYRQQVLVKEPSFYAGHHAMIVSVMKQEVDFGWFQCSATTYQYVYVVKMCDADGLEVIVNESELESIR